jgi:hypothetical protein
MQRPTTPAKALVMPPAAASVANARSERAPGGRPGLRSGEKWWVPALPVLWLDESASTADAGAGGGAAYSGKWPQLLCGDGPERARGRERRGGEERERERERERETERERERETDGRERRGGRNRLSTYSRADRRERQRHGRQHTDRYIAAHTNAAGRWSQRRGPGRRRRQVFQRCPPSLVVGQVRSRV